MSKINFFRIVEIKQLTATQKCFFKGNCWVSNNTKFVGFHLIPLLLPFPSPVVDLKTNCLSSTVFVKIRSLGINGVVRMIWSSPKHPTPPKITTIWHVWQLSKKALVTGLYFTWLRDGSVQNSQGMCQHNQCQLLNITATWSRNTTWINTRLKKNLMKNLENYMFIQGFEKLQNILGNLRMCRALHMSSPLHKGWETY